MYDDSARKRERELERDTRWINEVINSVAAAQRTIEAQARLRSLGVDWRKHVAGEERG